MGHRGVSEAGMAARLASEWFSVETEAMDMGLLC